MEYFSEFPLIAYDFSTDKEKISYLLRDITRNVRFRKDVLSDLILYDEYDIMDGETPELISAKVYGSPYFHWVVMLANEAYNWVEDYPLTDAELNTYIEEKYGSTEQAKQKIKHYVNSEGEVVYYSPDYASFKYVDPNTGNLESLNYDKGIIKPINCYDYEVMINESKRRIRLISPNVLSTVMKTFRDLM